jgi:hypothetical protein
MSSLLVEMGALSNFLPGLISNCNPPNLHLLNSKDYRGAPPHLAKWEAILMADNVLRTHYLEDLSKLLPNVPNSKKIEKSQPKIIKL